jgi:hypothetical protein
MGIMVISPLIYEALGWLKEHWPDMSQLILGIFALVLALRPVAVAKLEEKALWKVAVPIIVGIIAVSGFVLSLTKQDALLVQIKSLYGQINSGATKADIATVTGHIDAGFADVVNAIKGLPQSSKVPKLVVPVKPPIVLPSPPHVTFTQARGVSTNPQFPFALLVTIQSDQPVPIAFTVDCTGSIGDVQAFVVGQGATLGTSFGYRGNQAIVRMGYPQLTAQTPLVITILSKDDIRAIGIGTL